MITCITRPRQAQWWEYGKLAGLVIPALLIALRMDNPLIWAIAIHLFTDFTCQSTHTAIGKSEGDLWILAYHSFISGGYAGFIVGGLPGLVISVLVHFLVDCTRKFGLPEPVGPALDQLAHVITLVVIWVVL
jgi:hypothetical protein